MKLACCCLSVVVYAGQWNFTMGLHVAKTNGQSQCILAPKAFVECFEARYCSSKIHVTWELMSSLDRINGWDNLKRFVDEDLVSWQEVLQSWGHTLMSQVLSLTLLRLRLNVWCEGAVSWLLWHSCPWVGHWQPSPPDSLPTHPRPVCLCDWSCHYHLHIVQDGGVVCVCVCVCVHVCACVCVCMCVFVWCVC